ncbi:MAG: LacI family DNA-binding transcriptional regulator [Christensenellales bacterium]
MITLKDIAKECGVSVASVSKALNYMPGVGEKTAERIRECASRLGYLPNAAAKALKTNRSFNIGVLLLDEENHSLFHNFFVSVLEYFKVAVEEQGYDLMLLNRTIGHRAISYLEHCRHSNLDGVFIACIDFSDPEIMELADAGISLVSIDHTYPGHPSVYSDNEDGIRQAVQHAYRMGHRRIALVSGAASSVTDKRYEGYVQAMRALGLPIRPEYHRSSRYRDVQRTRAETSALLVLPTPPTCILMPDDYAALGGQMAIREAGMRIPEDISVIGFDGLDFVDYLYPRLTTVRQNVEAIGKEAARLLLSRIDKRDTGGEASIVKVPVSLIRGETVAQIS